MYWIAGVILILALGAGVILYLKLRPDEKKIIQLEKEGRLEEAVKEYLKLFEKKQITNNGLWRLIKLYIKMGKKDEAIDKLKYVLVNKRLPDRVKLTDAKNKLAFLLYDEMRDEEALSILLEIFNEGKYIPDILLKIGKIAYSQRDYSNARKFLNRYTNIVKKDDEALVLNAMSFIHLNEFKKSISIFKTLLKNEEKKHLYYFYLGMCYLWLHYFDQSYENFELAIQNGIKSNNLINSLRGEFIYNLYNLEPFRAKKNLEKAVEFILSNSTELEDDLRNLSIIDRVIMNLFYDTYDSENKPYDSIELNHMLDSAKVEDPEFFSDLRKELDKIITKEKEIEEKTKKKPQKSRTVKTYKEREKEKEIEEKKKTFKGISKIKEFYGIDKTKILIRWIDIGFPKYFLTNEYVLNRAEKFDTEKIFNINTRDFDFDEDDENDLMETPHIDNLMNVNKEITMKIARKVLEKLGLDIQDEVYVDEKANMDLADGIDFVTEKTNEITDETKKIFVAFRRWKSDNIGDFAVKSIYDTIKLINFDMGLFIAPAKLSREAKNFLKKHKSLRFIGRNQLEKILESVNSVNIT